MANESQDTAACQYSASQDLLHIVHRERISLRWKGDSVSGFNDFLFDIMKREVWDSLFRESHGHRTVSPQQRTFHAWLIVQSYLFNSHGWDCRMNVASGLDSWMNSTERCPRDCANHVDPGNDPTRWALGTCVSPKDLIFLPQIERKYVCISIYVYVDKYQSTEYWSTCTLYSLRSPECKYLVDYCTPSMILEYCRSTEYSEYTFVDCSP